MTSCTASFQETSANVGDTIHADFTWADAVKHGTEFWYSIMWIEDPNGETRTNFFNFWDAAGSQTLEFKTDTAGTWKCQIDVWQGVYAVPCTDTVTVGTTTSCTASFQETSAKIGDTIHADFTWANALIKQGEFHYAYMAIIDPSGVAKKNYFEFENNTGSKTLDYVVDEVGTWTCEIKVWNGFMRIECTDTVDVSGVFDITLDEAITCEECIGYNNHGPTVTEFDYNQQDMIWCYLEWGPTSHDFYGETIAFKWMHNGDILFEGSFDVIEHWYGVSWCINPRNWGYAVPAGTGYIEAYWQGTYLGKTNDYTVIGPIGAIGNISPQSTYYTGPFNPGDEEYIMRVFYGNRYDAGEGTIYYNLYEYPNTPSEKLLQPNERIMYPGQTETWYQSWIIPPTGPWPLGIKVWGDGETEPAWGTLGTLIFNIRSLEK